MKTLPLVCLAVMMCGAPLASAALMYEKYDLIAPPGWFASASLWIGYDNSLSTITRSQGLRDLWINTAGFDSFAMKDGVIVGTIGFNFRYTPSTQQFGIDQAGSMNPGEYFFGGQIPIDLSGKLYHELHQWRINPMSGQTTSTAIGVGTLRKANIPEAGETGAMMLGSFALIGLAARRFKKSRHSVTV